MRLKATLLRWHRWVGLILGLFLLVQALTGTALVFRDELDRLFHPSLTVAPQADRKPVQAILDTLARELPNHEIARLDMPVEPDLAVLARLKAKEGGAPYLAGVDPYTAGIVRHGGLSSWPTENLFHLHNELWSGDIGHQVVGVIGLSLLFLVVTGPIVWWPGRKRLRKGLSVTFEHGANRGWRELHRSVGAIAAAILLVTATTGSLMIWKEQVRGLIGTVGLVVKKPAPKVPEIEGQALLPVDRLIEKAQAGYGSSRLQQLRFPGKGGRVVAVYLDADGHPRPEASKQIWFNRYTGEDLGNYVAGKVPAGNEFVDWLFPVHTGRFLDLPGRILMFLAGLALIGLTLTGGWMWFSLRAQKAARRRRANSVRAAAAAPSAE